jgi:hypothetical protein
MGLLSLVERKAFSGFIYLLCRAGKNGLFAFQQPFTLWACSALL